MSIRFSNFFPTDRRERYYVEDRPTYDKCPEERGPFHKFSEDRRPERYHVEDRRPYDQFQEKEALAGAFRSSSAGNAQIDWKETADAHVFRLELPGVKKHEVKLEIEDNGVLCISTEIRAEKEEVTDIWRRLERSSGRFFRRFVLPDTADADKAKAEMSNGVLTVTVPKFHFKKPMPRVLHISGY